MNPGLPAYNKVFIKDHTARWASCSEKRNLNFSLLLAMLPIQVIDYVIIHELAHLVQLNHSKRFWDIVKKMDPEFETHRKMLHKVQHINKIYTNILIIYSSYIAKSTQIEPSVSIKSLIDPR